MHDVDEPRRLHEFAHLTVARGEREAAADALARLEHEVAPAAQRVIGAEEARVAARCNVVLAVFEVAARPEVGEGLAVEARPVVDAAREVADVDEVEVAWGPAPRELGVVDEEAAVGRYPGGLDGGDVGADYLG